MATPSGQISFGDLSVEILQAGSTSERNMNDAAVRLGYGSTSQVSISDLKKAWGCTITEGTYTDKFGSIYGYDTNLSIGSSDDTSITGTSTLTQTIYTTFSTNTFTRWSGNETGFRASGIARWAIGGTNITGFSAIDGSGTDDELGISSQGTLDGSGTTTVGMKWN